jgi:hypothetical protein
MTERYRYLYLRNEHGHPVAVVAYLLPKGEAMISYALATFNPNDRVVVSVKTGRNFDVVEERQRRITFDRKFLRKIAEERLRQEPKTVSLPAKEKNGMKVITRALMETLSKDKTLPNRTKKAVRLWLSGKTKTPSLKGTSINQ